MADSAKQPNLHNLLGDCIFDRENEVQTLFDGTSAE